MEAVKIGNKWVGEGYPCFVVAEIGINHSGNLEIAKKMIDAAIDAGADVVKFQKRTVEIVYTAEALAKPRENPFGATSGDLKRALEFGQREYQEINEYCRTKNIMWLASCWDEESVDFIEQFDPVCYKIASPSLTDKNLLLHTRSKNKPIILSTGMSTLEMVDEAIDILGKNRIHCIMACTSTYPTKPEEGNVKCVTTLKERYPWTKIGFSNHYPGLMSMIMAFILGAEMIEFHATLDRSMIGSDQASSIEPKGVFELMERIKLIEKMQGDGIKKIFDSELEIMKKLRK